MTEFVVRFNDGNDRLRISVVRSMSTPARARTRAN
jgi:hypothetical protein